MKKVKFTLNGKRQWGLMYPSGAIRYSVRAETWFTHSSEVTDLIFINK